MAATSYLDKFDLKVRGKEAKSWLPYVVQAVPDIFEALTLDSNELYVSGTRGKDAFYGLGATLVFAIGADRLLGAIEELLDDGGTILTPQQVLKMAGLDPLNQIALTKAFAKAIGESNIENDTVLVLTIKESELR